MKISDKKLGFGFMRLPMTDGKIDLEETTKMVDEFLANGFNYFDTAACYVNGDSEKALKICLTERYDRSKYVLTDKLTNEYFKTQADIVPFFENQLKTLGVEYLDFYLMHSQTSQNYNHFKECNAYETAFELKKQGKIRHVGISFHDKAEFLEKILSDYPEIEVVQIQFNYLDYDDASVESRKCYEVCRKHGKPVIVMEPVKGGRLVNLPKEAQVIFDELDHGSNASYAIRFAAGFEGIEMVLSGMSNLSQLKDNIGFMKNFTPLNNEETEAVKKVCGIITGEHLIPCTDCKYCVAGCPKNIRIPELFACYNSKKTMPDWNQDFYYNNIHTVNHGKASDCIKCGKCEKICPQHLPIRRLLENVAGEFEKTGEKS